VIVVQSAKDKNLVDKLDRAFEHHHLQRAKAERSQVSENPLDSTAFDNLKGK